MHAWVRPNLMDADFPQLDVPNVVDPPMFPSKVNISSRDKKGLSWKTKNEPHRLRDDDAHLKMSHDV